MARHHRYHRPARLSRRAASAAFEDVFSFYTNEQARYAAEQLWTLAKVKARAVGNEVHYEDPLDEEESAFVEMMLEDMLDELGSMQADEEDALFDEQEGTYDDLGVPEVEGDGVRSMDFKSPEDVAKAADLLEEKFGIDSTRAGLELIYELPDDPDVASDIQSYLFLFYEELYGEEYSESKGYAFKELYSKDDDEFDDDEGEEWKRGELAVEEPEDVGYEPPSRARGKDWKPTGPWVDLVIDYSQLPDKATLSTYGYREMRGLDEDQLVDILENYEDRTDREGQQDFIAALLYMRSEGFPGYEPYWDYIRAYEYAQKNKGAGLSRLIRRVKGALPSVEAARRTHKR